MRRFGFPVVILFGLVLLMASLWPRQAEAVPVFARQVGAPCTQCHVQFPKLNDFGMAFKQNGYRLKGDEGKFIWQKTNFPLATMISLQYENRDETDATGASTQTGAVTRGAVEFFSGGSVGPTVSYFLDYAFEQTVTEAVDATGAVTGDTVTVNEAIPGGTFLIFNDLMPDNLLNLRVGVMSNEFFHLSAPRRTTMEDYISPVSVDNVGLEVNGIHSSGFRYAVGFGNDEVETADNHLRAFYGWGTYGVAGQTLGVRYSSSPAGPTEAAEETHSQVDANLDLHYGPANLILGYFTQDNVGGVADDTQNNLLAELVYAVGPKVLLTARYETQETETGGVENSGTNKEAVLNVSYYILPNMSLLAEYANADRAEQNTEANIFMAGVHVDF